MEHLRRVAYMVVVGDILTACIITLGVLTWQGIFEIHRDLPDAIQNGALLLAATLSLADALGATALPTLWRRTLMVALPVGLTLAGLVIDPHEPRKYVDLLAAVITLGAVVSRAIPNNSHNVA